MREKILQGRELEKTYQKEQGKKQKEAFKNFVDGLKKLGIDSIIEYHKLVKEKGHKGRNIKVIYAVDENLPVAIKQAISTKTDTLVIAKSTKDLVYVADITKIGKRVNQNYCNEHNISFVEFMFKGQEDKTWLSVTGNYCAVLLLSKPVSSNTTNKKLLEAMKKAFKIEYNLDIEYNSNGDGKINNKKICGGNVISETGDMKLMAIGISLKKIENIADSVFPKEFRHLTTNDPTSVEDILGREINAKDFVICLIEELSKSMESEFNSN